jgi:Protein of unknown function (DUF3168)
MSDPSAALQTWIYGTLSNAPSITALVADRVFDNVADVPIFPYINIGEGYTIGDDTEDCGDGSEVYVQIHAWSRKPGFPEVKSIAAAIRATLRAAIPVLSGFEVTVAEFVQARFLRDPDGLTRHALVEFRYLITHTA